MPVITVGNVEGVRVSGLLLQAGVPVYPAVNPSPSLLQWGHNSGMGVDGDWTNPGFLHDVYARVGGYNDESTAQVSTTAMLVIFGGNVVIDNAWLWRADHSASGPIMNKMNSVDSGLHVFGKNVTAYGLSVENTLKNQVEWAGENGNVWFYQSTFPYDADATWAVNNYVSYSVKANV